MKLRTLLGTLLIVTGFWYFTSRANWSLRSILTPIATSTHQWADPVTAHGSVYLPDEQNNIDIYKANRMATVNITSVVYQRDIFFQIFPSKGTGSGFIINDSGEIVTNNHVISGSRNITVSLLDKKQYPARVIAVDPRNDLAVVQIDAGRKLPFVHLGDSDAVQVGEKVLAIGNPFNLEGTLTTGIVSSVGRALDREDGTRLEGLIQTDAAINPGNSGGPMFDSHGNVIGINTAILSSPASGGEAGNIGIGFAMPINRVKAMLEELRTTGHVSVPVLGITSALYVRGDLAVALNLPETGGLLIQGMDDGSPAERGGLRGPRRFVVAGMTEIGIGGDLIIAIDGKPVEAQDALRRALNQKRGGDEIVFTVFRNGRTLKVPVKLGSAPTRL